MDNKNYQQKKKKKGSGFWGLAVLIIIWVINRLDSGDVRRFFSRLQWSIRTGRFDLRDKNLLLLVGAIIAVTAVLLIITVAAKTAKAKRFDGVRRAPGGSVRGGAVSPMSGQSVQHSHDRLQGYRGEENGAEHWKKQLDGFLEAGIIDRSEYRVLLERRRR